MKTMRTTTARCPLFSANSCPRPACCLSPAAGFAAGKTQVLFDGKDLAGWRKPTGTWTWPSPSRWTPPTRRSLSIAPGQGVLLNSASGHTVDLITEPEFGDMEAHVEFCIARHSNSGVYLMGRYEIQIYDSFGVAKDKYPGIECGGIYPRWINEKNVEGHSPRVNASRRAGQWQTFDITFRAPRFDASGKKIANAKSGEGRAQRQGHSRECRTHGPTRGPMGEDEKPTGPIRLQGDHGPVAYRNLRVSAVDLK